MEAAAIQKVRQQVNMAKRWFYLKSRDAFGVDITGIVLPNVEMTVSGMNPGFTLKSNYDYLQPTEYDRAQQEAQMEGAVPDITPEPRVYAAMKDYLYKATLYLDALLEVAQGNSDTSLDTRRRNLLTSLQGVEKEARTPPHSEARQFTNEIAQCARAVQLMVTADRPYSLEEAEMVIQREASAQR